MQLVVLHTGTNQCGISFPAAPSPLQARRASHSPTQASSTGSRAGRRPLPQPPRRRLASPCMSPVCRGPAGCIPSLYHSRAGAVPAPPACSTQSPPSGCCGMSALVRRPSGHKLLASVRLPGADASQALAKRCAPAEPSLSSAENCESLEDLAYNAPENPRLGGFLCLQRL